MIKTIWRHPKIPKIKNERKYNILNINSFLRLHENSLTNFPPKNNE